MCGSGRGPSDVDHSFVQTDCAQDGVHHAVRITVGAGPAILKVAASYIGHGTRDANRRTAMGYARTKVGNFTGLMGTGQTALVVFASARIVGSDMTIVLQGQLLNCRLYLLDTARRAHLLRGHVGVGAGSIPIARNRLRVQANNHAILFGYPLKNVAGHPQVVTYRHTDTGSHLEWRRNEDILNFNF